MSRREKKKPSKAERQERRLRRETQELDKIVQNTAGTFRSSFETGRDCASECRDRLDDLRVSLDFRRLTLELWSGRPGADDLVSAMADLAAENERHLVAIEQLLRRFEDLEKAPWWDVLSAEQVPEDLIRRRLFDAPPT
ncbi:MAG TPA: hypothetical protein VFP50_12115 [Anaeromyxobacteraceae bacterium]|nr:hypothetical protein [Anaeromyxobacteraceae bacterium]